MSDNRDLTETFHQKISSLLVSIASDSRHFQSSQICFSVTKYSNLQLPVKVVYIERSYSQLVRMRRREGEELGESEQ